MKQEIFDFDLKKNYANEDFFVSKSNMEAFNAVNENKIQHTILKGPKKSGKTHLGLLWKKNNNAITYNKSNYQYILRNKKHIFIDNFLINLNEEFFFHIINHSYNYDLKILICVENNFSTYKYEIDDFSSRLRTFNIIKILNPDDDLLNNLLLKLLHDRQIIINNLEIFSYIAKRINRTYLDVFKFVEKIDKLSLEKKRQLTIPLIKELL